MSSNNLPEKQRGPYPYSLLLKLSIRIETENGAGESLEKIIQYAAEKIVYTYMHKQLPKQS